MTDQPILSPDWTQSGEIDEVQVMQAAQQDPAQFAPLYEVYFPRIYGYCARRTNTPQEAEDLTSMVFIKALRGLGTYQGGNVGAWLFRIAHNEMVNHWRGTREQVSLEANQIDLPADNEPPIEQIVQEEAEERVRSLMERLPPDQKTLLDLKLGGKLTSAEIGAVIGKSASAVRVEMHRIVKLLRVMYFEERKG